MDYPKFEKVNDNIIRIIVERAEEVSLAKLIETKNQLEEKKTQIEASLININEILENATKLGIVPEEKKEE